MFFMLVLCCVILTVATFLPIARWDHWVVRDLDFIRIQVVVLWLLLLVVSGFVLSGAALILVALLAVVSIGYEIFWIVPYTRLFSKQVSLCPKEKQDDSRRIRIVTANVMTPNRDWEKLVTQILDIQPDVVVTLETDLWWQERLDILELQHEYIHTLKCPLDNLYGMHLYSRFPLYDARVQFLVEDDKPSIVTDIELRDGSRIKAYFLHPAPPSPTENEKSTERDVELLMVAAEIRDVDRPIIVTGDLNDVAWSRTTRTFRKISQLLDPRIGRGMFNTFHAKYWFLRWPLDHIFHSDHFVLRDIFRLQKIGSDHFPLCAELQLAPELRRDQKKPDIKQEDRDFYKEEMEKKDSVKTA